MIPPEGTVTTYTAYSAAVLAALEAHFGTDFHYGNYEQKDDLTNDPELELRTPGFLLEMTGYTCEPSEPPDVYGRRARRFRVNIYCLLGYCTDSLQVALRDLGLEVDGVLSPADPVGTRRRGAQWGLGVAVDPAVPLAGDKDDVYSGMHGVGSFVVSFEQVVYLA
jgi:hypothetical protein